MVSDVVLASISAIVGGSITLFVTYFNNKARRYELEYNYRKKVEERHLFNAQKHLDDLYKPLYIKVITFQNHWIDIRNSANYETLGNEIDILKKFKKILEDTGSTAFLTTEIENRFDHLLDFLSKSQDASKIRYGVNEQYHIFGQEESFYHVLPEWYSKNRIILYKIIVPVLNLSRNINWAIMTGLLDYKFEIIVDSAPIRSNDFDAQLIKFSRDINEKIKEITLGIK